MGAAQILKIFEYGPRYQKILDEKFLQMRFGSTYTYWTKVQHIVSCTHPNFEIRY